MKSTFLFADILIADSETDFVRKARMVLQSAGYTVRRVESGAGVIAAVRERPPDLILLAATLPDVNGHEATRQIKADATLPFIPIIMLDVQGQQEQVAAALNAGADEFLQKSVANAELLVRVRAMLRLKGTTDALAELNATLEQKVVERTQALKQAHARLRHAEKLSALGRLAASVAHDINNPLSGILNYLYLVKQDVAPDAPLMEDLLLIERQVKVIANLVRQLQNFSRPPRKEHRAVSLHAVLQDILALTRKDLEKRGIDVACQWEPDLPAVLAAPDQMSEVFMNLVVNARDAMPDGGTLTIQAYPENGHVMTRVIDTGVGITPEVQTHLFEPFFTTKGDQGTGLGLAICYRIIQEHDGDISVESRPNEGTTFAVRLPQFEAGV